MAAVASLLVELGVEETAVGEAVAAAGQALVGLRGGGWSPGSVHVERRALLAVDARRVVLTVADQLLLAPTRRLHALVGMAVALASAAHRKVADGVEVGASIIMGCWL